MVTVARRLETPRCGNAAFQWARIARSRGHAAAVLELGRRDSELYRHGYSVGRLAERTALALGLDSPYADQIRLAGVLHDVGKLAVPHSVLSKPGPLTGRERRLVERHPSIGEALVRLAGLHREAHWIRHHHERLDGLGYPDRLVGHQIPLPSRIILVVDAFDALTCDRPYRSACTRGDAVEEIAAHSGSQFDPACVAALEQVLEGSCPDRRGLDY